MTDGQLAVVCTSIPHIQEITHGEITPNKHIVTADLNSTPNSKVFAQGHTCLVGKIVLADKCQIIKTEGCGEKSAQH